MFCCDESDVDLNKNESSSMKDYENARIFYTVLTVDPILPGIESMYY